MAITPKAHQHGEGQERATEGSDLAAATGLRGLCHNGPMEQPKGDLLSGHDRPLRRDKIRKDTSLQSHLLAFKRLPERHTAFIFFILSQSSHLATCKAMMARSSIQYDQIIFNRYKGRVGDCYWCQEDCHPEAARCK